MNFKACHESDLTLIMDIGSGTQDVLIYQPDKELENCFKLVIPSATQNKAREICSATAQKAPLFLKGQTMGGGACVSAIKNHLKAGLSVYATKPAAKTIKDNLDKVQALGIKLVNKPPKHSTTVVLEDVEIDQWYSFFKLWSLKFPARFAVAVQDHGDSPEISNRTFRMDRWRKFMDSGGDLENLVYRCPPAELTRMKAVENILGKELMLMDTGSAAICGALEDATVNSHYNKGVVIVNLGNSHTLIAIVKNNKLLALCEHHTSKISPEKLSSLISRLAEGSLTHQEIFDDKGHGVALANGYSGLSSLPFIAVTGPRRALSVPLKYYQAVPHGDMMLAGCFGLLRMGRQIGFIT